MTKACARCGAEKPISLNPKESGFWKDAGRNDGFDYACKDCRASDDKIRHADRREGRKSLRETTARKLLREVAVASRQAEKEEIERKASQKRLTSDFAELKPRDFAVGVGNDPRTPKALQKEAAQEKRQEWSEAMGAYSEAVRTGQGLDKELARYIGGLAEQERRFANRRLSRSVSIHAAHDELARELFKATARQFFSDRIIPKGWAEKPDFSPKRRTVVALFSDLHLGASMDERSNPLPFRAVEEARRFEYFLRQILDYKPQYRKDSSLLLLLNGDLIDGFLMHDQRAGLPLTEQKAVFWHFFRIAMAELSAAYPSIKVVGQPGNHGRNVARHPGRATEDKWDGVEWDMMYALSCMCSGLRNVSFDLPFRAVSVVDLYGSKLLVTHGDTEPGLTDPDSGSEKNAALLAQINSSRQYGCEFDAVAAGHWHKGRYLTSRHPRQIFNGALVPPNGFARSKGLVGERQGQFLWEAVEGHPVGDVRFVEVGPAQDKDEKLGKLITPFRFPRPEGDASR